ncbi:MlaD family protein, partial [Glaciimonas sp. CA11.2]
MQQKSVDGWVGLFVVFGALALIFLAFKAGNLGGASFQASYPVISKFDNIGGLKPRAPVKSAGVVVGRVGAIN